MTGLSVSLGSNRVHGAKYTNPERAKDVVEGVARAIGSRRQSTCQADNFSSTVAADRRRLNRGT